MEQVDEQAPSNRAEIAPGVWTGEGELRFHFARSGGPGGQNVNKVNTKAELRVGLAAIHGLSERAMDRLRLAAANRITTDGELLIVSDSERTQERNRQECMGRLRALILSIVKDPKPRRKTRPSKTSVQKRIDKKRARGEIKKQRSGNFDF